MKCEAGEGVPAHSRKPNVIKVVLLVMDSSVIPV
jgi:hypothetical protein